jgi:hypothetical protein
MRRYGFVLTGLAATLVAFVAWAGVWRPAAVLRHAGVTTWWPEAMRTCRDGSHGPWRSCDQERALASSTLDDREQVSFHRFTRTISFAEHSWQVRDSVLWRRAADSVRHALTNAGGTPLPCPRINPDSGDVASLEAWRFGDHDVRLETYRFRRPPPSSSIAWVLQVVAMPEGYTGCAPWLTRRRLLTPTELLAHFQRWLLDDNRAAGLLP